MRLALIANPHSGTAPAPERLQELLAKDGAEVHVTPIDELTGGDGRGLDEEGLADAVRKLSAPGRPDRVVVAGGDGSIGPAALLAAEIGVPLAAIPVGTANDFARAKGLPMELEAACALARSPEAVTRRAELAFAGGRPFVNAASAGLSVVAADAAKPYKSRLGPLAYAVGALRAGTTATPLRCTVAVDGDEVFAGDAWQVVVAATGAFGGGSEIGGTDPTDDRLDIAIVPAGSRLALVRRAHGMRTGKLVQQADVDHHRGKVIEVRVAGGRAAFNVDGELCHCDPPRFDVRPGGFEVIP